MSKIVLASGNAGKIREFQDFLGDQIISPEKKIEVVEGEESFEKNAYLKASAYYKVHKCPVLSDDSGLVVAGLPGELGIKSARFGGDITDSERCDLLLKKLGTERSAYFVCVLCYFKSPEEFYFFEGRLQGSIGQSVSGTQGFGYDPLFIPKGKNFTLAEDKEWKKSHSHRVNAIKELQKFLHSCQSP